MFRKYFGAIVLLWLPLMIIAQSPQKLIDRGEYDQAMDVAIERLEKGRGDATGNYVSLKLAQPRDWWFHVRGMPGSHVVLRAKPAEKPDRETLKRAAAIAAYHSKARNGGTVPVACTRARFVTKPRGAKPGTVSIRKETIFRVRPSLIV